MKKEIEAFVNAANEQELEAAWNNLSAEEQRVFEQLMEEDSPEDALAFFAQLYDDAPKEQTSETVSISENEIYFKRKPLTEEQKKHGCKAKVFVKEKSGFSKQIGTPDLMILFTNTVSHKMVLSAVTEAKKNDVNIVRTHSSSAASLTSVLETYLSESRAC